MNKADTTVYILVVFCSMYRRDLCLHQKTSFCKALDSSVLPKNQELTEPSLSAHMHLSLSLEVPGTSNFCVFITFMTNTNLTLASLPA